MLQSSANKLRRVEGGEDGMPLVVQRDGAPVNGGLCRTTSCVEDPQTSALDCLKTGELRMLADILSDLGHKIDINKDYPDEHFKTLIQIAVEKDDLAAVKILLRGGANPSRVNPVLKTTPVHVAASMGNFTALAILTEYGGSECMSVQDRAGRIPLHHAILACKKHPENGLQCVRVCIEKGCNVNALDTKGGQTPLYLAASIKDFKCVKYLLHYGADSSIPCQGMSTRQLIFDSFKESEVALFDFDKSADRTESKYDQLMALVDKAELDGPDDTAFAAALARAPIKDIDWRGGKKTLVQLCAERGLESYLLLLLRKGANPNLTTEQHSATPLTFAARGGFNNILQILLEEGKLMHPGGREGVAVSQLDVFNTDSNGMTVLHNVLRKPYYSLEFSDEGNNSDYTACLNILLGSKVDWSKVINKQDINGNTGLHYAVQFWDQETVTKLLLIGANIGLKNMLGEAPISSILPQTMEEFLNNHCISSKGNPTNDDFKISFKYDFLAPPRENLPRELRPETSTIKPWNSIKDDPEATEDDDGQKSVHPETEVLWYMAGSKEHRYLLKHPVITSFLCLKWSRISVHYNSNLAFYTTLVVCLTSYIFCLYGGPTLGVSTPHCANSSHYSVEDSELTGPQLGLWWTLLVLILLLGIREVFQFTVAAGRYFYSIENIIEVALVVSVSLLLGYGQPGCHVLMKRELSAAALMFSWIELVTMVGRHPMLTSYNTYLTMFYRVLKTFLQFLTWYSLFILAFALSFFILLHNDTQEEGEYKHFDYIGLSIVKTFSMFVGELEFSDLPLSSPFSYVFFLCFLFLIVVVLMNLLNGLAVSDTGLIREEAEIHSHVCRVEVISAAEATILGDPAHILTGQGKIFPSCGIRRKLGAIFRVRKLFRRLLGSNSIMLFYSVLPDKRLVVYPNRKSLVCSPCLSNKDVSRDILDSAKNLLLKMNRTNKEKGIEAAIEHLRIRQESMDEKLEKILNKLENMSNSLKL